MTDKGLPSTRPYLVRALYEWCTDNGLTPYVAVKVDGSVQVPRDHVKDGEIILNISFDATSGLHLGNEFIEFKARFAGKAQDIVVPLNRVIAIYARENGQGMVFPLDDFASPSNTSKNSESQLLSSTSNEASVKRVQLVPNDTEHDDEPPPPQTTDRNKPSLKRVK